jgi:Phosphotransferase enzyme family
VPDPAALPGPGDARVRAVPAAPPDARPGRRAEMTRRAVAAALAVARAHGLRVVEPVVLADQFSVQVHLTPAPVVAGVSTWTAVVRPDIVPWLARKVAVTDHLEAVGAPVVGNARELPPGPHEHDGLAMTFTAWAPPDPDRTPDVADCLAMLPDLHTALATYPGELPLLAPVQSDVPRGLAALERHPDALTAEDRDRLLSAHARLASFATDPGDTTTVLHGDVHPGNLHATGGELRWLDFEDVCRGPVGYDLALLRWMDPTAGDGWADPAQLARCSDLRAVYLALCLLAFRDAFGDDPEWDGYIRDFVRLIKAP